MRAKTLRRRLFQISKGTELTKNEETKDDKKEQDKKEQYVWIHILTGKHGWAYGDPDNPSPDDEVTGNPPEWPLPKE